jgi:hypothetical protein
MLRVGDRKVCFAAAESRRNRGSQRPAFCFKRRRLLVSTQLNYLHRRPEIRRDFRCGVSLHSHTLHSREGAGLVAKAVRRVPALRAVLHQQHRKFGGTDFERDVSKFWWTSPLSAGQALSLERSQIEEELGLDALVSISDHDNIEAPSQLQCLESNDAVPVSVEWTAPFGSSYFHLGVHNLPPRGAKAIMARLREATATRRPQLVDTLLRELSENPGVLIVFNHPLWDLPCIGQDEHNRLLLEFLPRYNGCIHALEINGLRDGRENRGVIRLARETGLPIISGGDRHGREPNATINLTNARTFGEFAEQVRSGSSCLLVMPQYLEPLKLRLIQTTWEIVRDDPDHSLGWTRWQDRVFMDSPDGETRSLAELLRGQRTPLLLRQFVRTVRLLASPQLRPALQFAMAGGPELTL